MTTEAGKRHVRLLACGAKVPGHVAVCGYDRESPIHDLWPEIGLRDFYVGRESDRHEYVPGEPEDMCEECRREWPCDVIRAEAEAVAAERTRIAEAVRGLEDEWAGYEAYSEPYVSRNAVLSIVEPEP